MAYLNRRDNSRDNRRSSDRRGGSESRQMFDATCDSCGNKCEVPFRPTEGKPVYCSDCFRKNQPSSDRRPDSRFSSRSNSEPRNFPERSAPAQPEFKGQFMELNNKLDKILKLLQPEMKKVVELVSEVKTEVQEKVNKVKSSIAKDEKTVAKDKAPVKKASKTVAKKATKSSK